MRDTSKHTKRMQGLVEGMTAVCDANWEPKIGMNKDKPLLKWNYPVFYQKLGRKRSDPWHIDNGIVGKFVTLCGKPYNPALKDTNQYPESDKVCAECRKVMAKLILRLGLPPIAAEPDLTDQREKA